MVSPNGLLNLLPPCVHGHIARQVLVLPLDGVQVLQHLLVGRLHAEELRAEVAALGLAAADLPLPADPPPSVSTR